MQFHPADSISLFAFSIFAVFMAFFCARALSISTNQIKEKTKWIVLFTLLNLTFGIVGASGLVIDHFIPFGPMLFFLIFVFGISFSFSASAKGLIEKLPVTVLIGFQGFRAPLELILHQWTVTGTIPETMTWTGQNLDIFTGIISVISIPLLEKSRKTVFIVNTVGFLLLLNVIRVVIMSSPFPFSWSLEHPLLLVAYFPYCMIAPLFVMPALIGHLLVYKKLKT